MRSTPRVMVGVLLALAAVPAVPVSPGASGPGAGGIDETVLVVGEDRAVVPIPRPPIVEEVTPLAPDLRLPVIVFPAPVAPVLPPWSVPRPDETLALLGGTD